MEAVLPPDGLSDTFEHLLDITSGIASFLVARRRYSYERHVGRFNSLDGIGRGAYPGLCPGEHGFDRGFGPARVSVGERLQDIMPYIYANDVESSESPGYSEGETEFSESDYRDRISRLHD